jgi:hypothetical protein
VNDRDIYGALIPRLMPGGKGIFISTPWPVPTLMGELFEKNYGKPLTALAARADTLTMRDDDAELAKMIAAERLRDEANAAREFFCDASMSGAGSFFDAAAIAAAVDPSLVLPRTAQPGTWITCGADFAFRSDSSALAVVHRVDDVRYVADLLELRPQRGVPLQPSDVVRQFAAKVKAHGCNCVMADGHYRESIFEHLATYDLGFSISPEGQTGKASTYVRARTLLHEGLLRLPNEPRLLGQLRDIVSKPTPDGGVSITSPRRAGMGHGDIVSSLVLALYQRGGHEIEMPPAKPGTPEFEAALVQKMLDDEERDLTERMCLPWYDPRSTTWDSR